MSVSTEELNALHAFCNAERELQRVADESKNRVREASMRRDECMTTLLACMEDKNVECIAVSSAGIDVKYARITQSHTTRDLTPNLVKQIFATRHEDIINMCKSKTECTADDIVNTIYEVVKDERNTYKPIVTFSNSFPRGMDASALVDVSSDERMKSMVMSMKECQSEHARLIEDLRQRRRALEEQRDQHVDAVDAYLRKQTDMKQVIVDGSGACLYLRKKTVKRTTPLTVAQFKAILSTALEMLQDEVQEDKGLPPVERLITVVTELMEKTKMSFNKEIIKLDLGKAGRRASADEASDEA